MDALGEVFGINEYIWQQQGNGELFVGAWADSYWASRPLTLPEKLFTGHQSDEGANIPVLPALRPGIKFNNKYYIQSVKLSGSNMRVTWSKRLKK